MDINLQDISWQKEFIEIQSLYYEIFRPLLGGARGWWNIWKLGRLHAEYEQIIERKK